MPGEVCRSALFKAYERNARSAFPVWPLAQWRLLDSATVEQRIVHDLPGWPVCWHFGSVFRLSELGAEPRGMRV